MKRGTKNLVLILMLTGAMIVTGTFSYIPAAAEGDTISLQDESIGGTTGSDSGHDPGDKGDSDGGSETEEKGFWEQEEEIGVEYYTHVQGYGDQTAVTNGDISGTIGESRRLEAISISLTGLDETDSESGIQYMTQIQDVGWEDEWSAANGGMSGTSGKSKRLEAIRIRLDGPVAEEYDVYYRVYCQNYGWLSWAKNGEYSGSEGLGKRLEAIQIMLMLKNEEPGNTWAGVFNDYEKSYVSGVLYRTHVQDVGWQSYVENGKMSGTTGKSYRLEGINIKLTSDINGGIRYRTHVQDLGWEKNWASNGGLSGTSGKSKRLEAIEIELTGEAAGNYNVYYRVHCQDYGWLGWARDGETAGTEGYSKRLEAIEIKVVPKDQNAPGSTDNITNLLPNTEKSDMISVVEQQEEA